MHSSTQQSSFRRTTKPWLSSGCGLEYEIVENGSGSPPFPRLNESLLHVKRYYISACQIPVSQLGTIFSSVRSTFSIDLLITC